MLIRNLAPSNPTHTHTERGSGTHTHTRAHPQVHPSNMTATHIVLLCPSPMASASIPRGAQQGRLPLEPPPPSLRGDEGVKERAHLRAAVRVSAAAAAAWCLPQASLSGLGSRSLPLVTSPCGSTWGRGVQRALGLAASSVACTVTATFPRHACMPLPHVAGNDRRARA